MAKPELGTKRLCPACGTKYYDLNRDPITCPHCGTIFETAVGAKVAPERAVEPEVEETEIAAIGEGEAEVISLEEVEATGEAEEARVDEDEVPIPEEEALEIETEIEPEDEEAFLAEEAEEGDEDVAELLDVEGEDEDEV